MDNVIFENVYNKLILQEALTNLDNFNQYLPQPFSNLLLKLKQSMMKAINASKSELIKINAQVNIWRDKLVQAWKKFSNLLSPQQSISLNDTILDLSSKYTKYMHGFNTRILIFYLVPPTEIYLL